MIRRVARGLAIGLTLAAASLVALTSLLFYRPLPTIDGYFRLLGLHERGEVVRDLFGIPHLYAQDTHDLYFLQGYVTAQDRLAEMDALRSSARAAAFASARTAAARASPPLADALEAYAAGVSKLIAQYSEARALPAEVVLAGRRVLPWEPTDTLAIVSAYLERITPASVCASAASARTAKGRPVMAAELSAAVPEPGWYEIGLDAGDVRAVGVSLPGVPGIVAGHNGWVAWAVLSSARAGSDPGATLGSLLAALPAKSPQGFGDAMRGSAVASCLAGIDGRVGGTDRDQVAFVPADRPAVLGGDGGRGTVLGTSLEAAREVDVEAMRVLLGRPRDPHAGARVIVDLAAVDMSRATTSSGPSGLRGSPHYGDERALWEIGELHRLPFSRITFATIDGDLVLRAR